MSIKNTEWGKERINVLGKRFMITERLEALCVKNLKQTDLAILRDQWSKDSAGYSNICVDISVFISRKECHSNKSDWESKSRKMIYLLWSVL